MIVFDLDELFLGFYFSNNIYLRHNVCVVCTIEYTAFTGNFHHTQNFDHKLSVARVTTYLKYEEGKV